MSSYWLTDTSFQANPRLNTVTVINGTTLNTVVANSANITNATITTLTTTNLTVTNINATNATLSGRLSANDIHVLSNAG